MTQRQQGCNGCQIAILRNKQQHVNVLTKKDPRAPPLPPFIPPPTTRRFEYDDNASTSNIRSYNEVMRSYRENEVEGLKGTWEGGGSTEEEVRGKGERGERGWRFIPVKR